MQRRLEGHDLVLDHGPCQLDPFIREGKKPGSGSAQILFRVVPRLKGDTAKQPSDQRCFVTIGGWIQHLSMEPSRHA